MPDLFTEFGDFEGFVQAGAQRGERWERAIAKTIELVENHRGLPQHRWEFELREAMSVETFPYLLGDVLDRQLLASFEGAGAPLDPIFKRRRLRDFRPARTVALEGMVQRLPVVLPGGEYTPVEDAETGTTIQLKKYGRSASLYWEAFLNDDLGGFEDFPKKLATSAVNTRAWLQTSLLFGATGPKSAFFAAGRGQSAVATTAFSITNLKTAVGEMVAYTSSTSEPIMNKPRFLVVPPSKEIEALDVLRTVNVAWTDGTGAAAAHPTANAGLDKYRLELIVDPWIPLIATSKTGSWGLFADPAQVPVGELGLLRGHERPEVFIKSSQQRQVGGTRDSSPFDGGFERDEIQFRVRYCLAVATADERAAWGSDGTS